MLHNIAEWNVDIEDSMSDHKMIHFKIKNDEAKPIEFRNRKKMNPLEFINNLKEEINKGRYLPLSTMPL